uniref:Uncharacterized protein n=1 Tax=Nelumbo nucifera TaxID=4432 RepID=A0A822YY09_NELNU|nr:TPA_asm: hypothetical protein HUJ06_004778 [Nelumbo nucifera]
MPPVRSSPCNGERPTEEFNPQLNHSLDFNTHKSRDHGEACQQEVRYGARDVSFIIKSYSGLLKGTSLPTIEMIDNIYKMNCSIIHGNISPQTENNPGASQGPPTSETNNSCVLMPSSSSTLAKPLDCSNTKEVHLMEQPLLMIGDKELLALNRGNAMLRYKEKKRTRRHYLLLSFCFWHLVFNIGPWV